MCLNCYQHYNKFVRNTHHFYVVVTLLLVTQNWFNSNQLQTIPYKKNYVVNDMRKCQRLSLYGTFPALGYSFDIYNLTVG